MSVNVYQNNQLSKIAGNYVIDSALSTTSTNAVQNRVVTNAINSISGSGFVGTASEVAAAIQAGTITDGEIVTITDDNTDTLTATEVTTSAVSGQATVEGALGTLNTNLGSPSSASGVTGANAFAKINTLNANLTEIIRKSNFTDRTPDSSGIITIPGNYTTANFTLIGANINRTGWCITIAQGTNQWELKITDPDSGAPITGNVSGTAYFIAK